MPRCLKCDVELDYEETLDGCVEGNIYEQEEIGFCPCCGTRYFYVAEFKFSKFHSLEEMEDE